MESEFILTGRGKGEDEVVNNNNYVGDDVEFVGDDDIGLMDSMHHAGLLFVHTRVCPLNKNHMGRCPRCTVVGESGSLCYCEGYLILTGWSLITLIKLLLIGFLRLYDFLAASNILLP